MDFRLDGWCSRIGQPHLVRLRRMQFGHLSQRLNAAVAQLELVLEDLDEESGAETRLQPLIEEPAVSDSALKQERRPLQNYLFVASLLNVGRSHAKPGLLAYVLVANLTTTCRAIASL